MESFGEKRNLENIEIENVGTQESETQPIPTVFFDLKSFCEPKF